MGAFWVAVFCCNLALADVIVMKNGDRVTGSIVKKSGKEVTIKTDKFGVVTTSWEDVESVKADKPVNLVLQDGRTIQGTMATVRDKIEVTAKDTTLSVAPADVTTIRDAAGQQAYERLLHPGWGQLWAGTGTIGFAGTSGNAKTLTFTTGVNAATTLVQSFRMFNDMSNTGDYRVNFDVGASTKISKWLTWNVSLSDRYLNNPAPGRKTNDLLYTTGLGITFAK
jgi:hypothetical protein